MTTTTATTSGVDGTALLGPRLVVAGTHSGVGKTTVATGLLAALRRAGHRPAGAKVGPDFIDPGYHALACGRAPRNLDAWLCGGDVIPALAGRAAAGADVLIVEGVMGLFDGSADGTLSSTADVARLLDAPVVLVVDAGAMSGSVAYSSSTPRPSACCAIQRTTLPGLSNVSRVLSPVFVLSRYTSGYFALRSLESTRMSSVEPSGVDMLDR